ncbi:hypothetical protein Hanom_Chr12g01106011 [Helianthus anomalus]
MYSLYAYIILDMHMYAANIYFWKHCRINYSFMFGFNQGTELSYQDIFLFSTGLAVSAHIPPTIHYQFGFQVCYFL